MKSSGTIYVVDNEFKTTEAISLLARAMHLECKTYTSGLKLLEEIDMEQPGCLISEVRIPDIGGLQLQRRLGEMGATTPVIFLTAHATVPMVVRAMKAGAFHVFTKPLEEQSLWEAVQDAIASDQEAFRKRRERRILERRLADVSPFEREVLDLVLRGTPNREIAEKQNVSVRTVELRRSRLMEKLGAKTLADLVRIGLVAKGVNGHRISLPETVSVS
ncbi:MAG: response regulator transcription factor [Pirellulaceae bacterium]|jgi:RNA polymerase sigma factor (sigma-70 family)|nr:response regulator [Thermoguttaceae bacterium]MDI9446461.1 response regulator [Planctomycetota bacterium]NLZ02259.1 response regulator transcription factor [Pirellulaceae bacterium]